MSLSFILIIMLPQIVAQPLPFGLLGFAARSGTGKTTLLKQLIPILKLRGLRLGLIKHSHHGITFDNRGLSRKVFEQGCDVWAVSDDISMAEWHYDNASESLLAGIETYRQIPIDLLLIEGFKALPFPKVEIHRQAVTTTLLCEEDEHIVALLSDIPEAWQEKLAIPVLDLSAVDLLADWIMAEIVMKRSN